MLIAFKFLLEMFPNGNKEIVPIILSLQRVVQVELPFFVTITSGTAAFSRLPGGSSGERTVVTHHLIGRQYLLTLARSHVRCGWG